MSEKKKSKKKKVKVFSNKKKGGNETEYIKTLQSKYNEVTQENVNTFNDLPLSQKTLKGLKDNKFFNPTEIQKATILPALSGKDILGAAQTGSGKTLAFLIPILEALFCKQWTNLDGLGALVITPTRELAYQIFETLRLVGQYHDFSAGLIIGGKDLKFERKRMDQCNIIIGTPGRLLQHMDENPLFDCANLQILVLDEADRCLDMGFEQTMNAIIANLPTERQTLLFSATQTKSVKDLVRLSLKDPLYIHVHQNMKYSTPEGLQQNYVVCELKDKVSILWSFIKNHLKSKSIIFFASCKQTKYMFEIFSKLRPGVSLMALYGTIHQLKRMQIYENFKSKHAAVLFATDLAARGLDFPEVHWVIQADCPDDANTYIHRVGRTARFRKGGESLLLLLPNELEMLKDLEEKKIPINKIDINPNKLSNPVKKMEAFLASKPELKETAKRAFTSYVKSVYLMKNKKIFNANTLDTNSYANSLGLAIAPRIRFLQRQKNQQLKAANEVADNSNLENNLNLKSEDFDSNESSDEEENKQALFDVDSDEEMLTIKRRDHDIDLPTETELAANVVTKKNKVITKAELAKKILKKNILPNKKIVFGEEGEKVLQGPKEKRSELAQQYEQENEGGLDIEKAKLVLKEEDKFDKQMFRERIKAKHKEQKRKLKEAKRKEIEDDEYDDDSEPECDLSWLPDPDKIYGQNNEENGENKDFSKVNEDDEGKEEIIDNGKISNKKRKNKQKKSDDHQAPSKKKKKLQELSSNLSVTETEELALMLLNKQ